MQAGDSNKRPRSPVADAAAPRLKPQPPAEMVIDVDELSDEDLGTAAAPTTTTGDAPKPSFVTNTEAISVLPKAPPSAMNALFAAARDKATPAKKHESSALAISRLIAAGLKLVTTSELRDRDSIFVGHAVAGIRSDQDVADCITAVKHSIRSGAAHPCIHAFVLPNGQCDFDDDGETYAGKKILTAIRDRVGLHSGHGLFVAVSRWFGGTMLGPVRFTHISSCAHDAIGAVTSNSQ
jgi:hypothetical protein